VYKYENTLLIDCHKFKAAVDEVLSVSELEVETFIKAGIYKLHKLGFDITNLHFHYWVNDTIHDHEFSPPRYHEFSSLIAYEDYLLDRMREQRKVFEKLRERLDIISKIDVKDSAFLAGKWLKLIGRADPIEWAIRHKYLIAANDPIVWAIDNNKLINGFNPAQWAVDKNLKVEYIPALEWIAGQFSYFSDKNRLPRLNNIIRFCVDNDLRNRIAGRAIYKGIRSYGIPAVRFLYDEGVRCVNWAINELHTQLKLPSLDTGKVQNLINSLEGYLRDSEYALLFKNNLNITIGGLPFDECRQAFELKTLVASTTMNTNDNIDELVDNNVIKDNKLVLHYIKDAFPLLKYKGGDPKLVIEMELNALMRAVNPTSSGMEVAYRLWCGGANLPEKKEKVLLQWAEKEEVNIEGLLPKDWIIKRRELSVQML
ncbi:MAG: hypothetical protein ACHP9Y_04195, partial [Gammaproteobacteria bacterium]